MYVYKKYSDDVLVSFRFKAEMRRFIFNGATRPLERVSKKN